jgi:hypothetical protein
MIRLSPIDEILCPCPYVRVFDPALCCSTGVCGPSLDPLLARFAADLDWLKSQGVSVERCNLAQQPAAFAADGAVKSALETQGEVGHPLVKVNGHVKRSGTYPSREELASWAGIGAAESAIDAAASREPVTTEKAKGSCEPQRRRQARRRKRAAAAEGLPRRAKPLRRGSPAAFAPAERRVAGMPLEAATP